MVATGMSPLLIPARRGKILKIISFAVPKPNSLRISRIFARDRKFPMMDAEILPL
jgi:hypothetical protein